MKYFLGRWRPALLAVFFGLASLVSAVSPVFTSSVSALAAPLLKTTTLSVISPDGTKNFDVTDGGGNSWKDKINTANRAPYRCESDSKSYLQTAITSGYYTVAQQTTGSINNYYDTTSPQAFVMISYSGSNYTQTLNNTGDYELLVNGGSGSAVRYAALWVDNSGNYNLVCQDSSGSPSNGNFGNAGYGALAAGQFSTQTVYLYYTTFTVTYPSGYSGTLPSTPPAAFEAEIVSPQFGFNTYKKTLTAKLENKIDVLPTYPDDDYLIIWNVIQCVGIDDITGRCDPGDPVVLVKQSDLGKDETFTVEVPAYGYYELQASYRMESCYRYPSYPATPDYCYYEIPDDTAEIDYERTYVVINIDGHATSGSTAGLECDVSGFCEPPSPYEDCGDFDVADIAGRVGCHIANFGTWLVIALQDLARTLFVPKDGFYDDFFTSFYSTLQDKFGFVYTAFQMLIDWLTSLLVVDADCTPTIGSGTFFGANLSFNFCAFEQSAPTIWNPLILIARLAIAAGFVFISFRRLIEIVKGLGS